MSVRRAMAGSALALALVAVSVPGFVVVNLGDEEPVDDRDLRSQIPVLADRDNGIVHLREAAALLEWPEPDREYERLVALSKGEDWDEALADEVIQANRAALLHLRRAVDAPALQGLAMRRLDDDIPLLVPCIHLARVSAIRALRRARAGDMQGAFEDALAPIQVGHAVQAELGSPLVNAMAGARLKRIGLEALANSVRYLPLAPEDSLAWSARLLPFRTDPAAWRAMWSAEYALLADSVFSVFARTGPTELGERLWSGFGFRAEQLAHWLPGAYLYKPNLTWRRYAALIRAHQAAAGKPCTELPGALPTSRSSVGEALELLLPNSLGDQTMELAELSLRRFELRRCVSDSRVSATVALIALRAYALHHATLPTSLEALVPDYLAELPRDPFDGAPLRYSAERRVLWSIGVDLRDGGGVAELDDEGDPSEQVFEICCS